MYESLILQEEYSTEGIIKNYLHLFIDSNSKRDRWDYFEDSIPFRGIVNFWNESGCGGIESNAFVAINQPPTCINTTILTRCQANFNVPSNAICINDTLNPIFQWEVQLAKSKAIYEFKVVGDDDMLPISITYVSNNTLNWSKNKFLTYNPNMLGFPSDIFQLSECNKNSSKISPPKKSKYFQDKRGFLKKRK